MTMCFCEKHGWQPGEEVSKFLRSEFIGGQDISRRIRDFSFVIEDVEWPFYGLVEEMEQLPEICTDGDFIIKTDERLSELLRQLTVMCFSCLKEAMDGAPLPVKEGAP